MKAKLMASAIAGLVALGAAQAQALDVEKSMLFAAPAAKVWDSIKDFCSIKDWHPVIVECSKGKSGDLLERTLSLPDGGKIVEVENFHADGTMTSIYSIVSSPLPLVDYASVITVTPVGDDFSQMTWRGRFNAPEGKDADALALISGFYTAGMINLSTMLGQ